VPRTLLFCTVLALIPFLCRAEQTVTTTETVIRLTVQPMAAPKPALRYLLLPELKEMAPGNPIPNYLKCTLDQDASAERENISKTALLQVDRAARLDKPDWQILLKVKTDGIGLLIPDVQKIRALAAALQIRFREELSQGRFDDALRTAKTMFAMSRHMSEHPTLIGDLVGIAIAFVAIGPLEEMLEQPGCPNLYWALTNLPNPMVPLDKGMEGERVLVLSEFRDLDAMAPMSEDQLKKVIGYFARLLEISSTGKPSKPETALRDWLNGRTKDEGLVRAARRRLVESGLPEERLLRFPAAQVILLDEKREYEVLRDEVMKLANLPQWEIEALLGQPNPTKEPALFKGLVPALHKVRRAQGRLEQRIALLRHVEALRMYAAAHDGKLPAKLADVAVPLPVDPFTGKPFLYTVEEGVAHLKGTPPPAEKKNPGFNIRYEVAIQK
jgi:hypothetical protein